MLPNSKKKLLEEFFLKYYFQEVSERQSIPLKHFQHPKGSTKRSLENFAVPKTINNYYISNISKSDKFKEDFLMYINESFNRDYEKIIDFKLNFLTKRWEEQLKSGENLSQTLNSICFYIEKNKKCKLPWDSTEIREAKTCTISLLE